MLITHVRYWIAETGLKVSLDCKPYNIVTSDFQPLCASRTADGVLYVAAVSHESLYLKTYNGKLRPDLWFGNSPFVIHTVTFKCVDDLIVLWPPNMRERQLLTGNEASNVVESYYSRNGRKKR